MDWTGTITAAGLPALTAGPVDRPKDETLKHDVAPSTRESPLPGPDQVRLLGVDIDNVTMAQTLDLVDQWVAQGSARHIAFVNAACLNVAMQDAEYRDLLARWDLVLPDGVGVRLGGRMRGEHVRDNVNGTDLFPLLCEHAAHHGYSLFLLGSADGVAAAAAETMTARVPGLRIAGTHHGFTSPEEEEDLLAKINASGADVLLVAMGVPDQEKWLERLRDRIDVPVRLGVGALFDLTSGRVQRAPALVRAARLEWAWRLAMEPRRMWRRYVLGNPVFLARAYVDARTSAHRTPPQEDQ